MATPVIKQVYLGVGIPPMSFNLIPADLGLVLTKIIQDFFSNNVTMRGQVIDSPKTREMRKLASEIKRDLYSRTVMTTKANKSVYLIEEAQYYAFLGEIYYKKSQEFDAHSLALEKAYAGLREKYKERIRELHKTEELCEATMRRLESVIPSVEEYEPCYIKCETSQMSQSPDAQTKTAYDNAICYSFIEASDAIETRITNGWGCSRKFLLKQAERLVDRVTKINAYKKKVYVELLKKFEDAVQLDDLLSINSSLKELRMDVLEIAKKFGVSVNQAA